MKEARGEDVYAAGRLGLTSSSSCHHLATTSVVGIRAKGGKVIVTFPSFIRFSVTEERERIREREKEERENEERGERVLGEEGLVDPSHT